MVDLGPLSQDPWLPPTLPRPPDTDESRGGGMKQLARPVAHRRWLWNGVAATVMILLEIEYVGLGALPWWPLCLSMPLAVVNWTGWWKTRPPRPRPDYARIALLEQELLGGSPEPRPLPPSGPGSATPAA